MRQAWRLAAAAIALLAWFPLQACHAAEAAAGDGATGITFKKHRLGDKFRSEGVAVGDFNGDGKQDIAAGSVYYAAPDWKMVPIEKEAKEFNPKGYSDSFCNFAEDLNGDGRDDLIVVGFPGKETRWYESPAEAGQPWKMHVVTPVTNNESPMYLDVDGDGRRELLCGVNTEDKSSDGPNRRMALVRPSGEVTQLWQVAAISAKGAPNTTRFSHGVGAGDINGDGRRDVLVPQGWWEAPASPGEGEWEFHPVEFGKRAAQMLVYDFDGDGDNDVLTSNPHAFGIWWHEQTGDGWQQHTIDDSFSQTHAIELADINGDGLMDFVTGKRWWAHGGRDPGGDQPAVFYWFELTRADGKPVWKRHQFDHDSGVGTQFQVADVNGDGLLDIVAASKKGVHYFEQVRE